MSKLREISIHRSLHRANTFMGGDREVVMLASLIAISSAVVGMNVFSMICGIVFWFIILIPARIINKKDPMMRAVFLSALHFRQRYFPPYSHVLANPRNNYKAVLTKTGMTYKG